MQTRGDFDVSGLPTVAFGNHNQTWWGTTGFMLVETTTLGILISSYFYLARNQDGWPPGGTPLPDLGIPTAVLVFMLLPIAPKALAIRRGRAIDVWGVVRYMSIAIALASVGAVLRIWEFKAVNVRWDDNAYGSVVWGLLVFHTLLLVVDLIEESVITMFLVSKHRERKHLADAEDSASYQFFLSFASLIVYLTIYIAPRVMR